MEPNRVGRTFGIGTRLAAKMLRSRASRTVTHIHQNAPVYAERGRRFGEGSRRFGRSIWRPFAHASSMLWLEVTGLFFGVFTAFFIANTIRLRGAWHTGPQHQRFLVYALCGGIFLYFTVSSFYRAANRRSRGR